MNIRHILTCIAILLIAAVILRANANAEEKTSDAQPVGPYKDFNGDIKLDVRDSKADWGPFTPKKAPTGAPNILFVLYDDTGLSAWSPYGGRINMPTLDKLAKNGLTYTQWHTCALCSPTRSTLLTFDPIEDIEIAIRTEIAISRQHTGYERLIVGQPVGSSRSLHM